jgi:hypothetical protein
LQAATVTAIPNISTLTLSSVVGLTTGKIISPTTSATAGQTITQIVGNNVSVASSVGWGTTGTISKTTVYLITPPTVTTLYRWNIPTDNSALVYDTAIQKWTPSVGQLVLGTDNVGLGNNVLKSLVTGSTGNVAIGNNTLSSLTTGYNLIGLGYGAGSAITTSYGNLILGNYTGYTAGGLDIRTSTSGVGVVATYTIAITNGTVNELPASLTVTFNGGVASTFFPASVTTASIPGDSGDAIVAQALVTVLQANPIINTYWTVSFTPAAGPDLVVLTQITAATVGFPILFSYSWSLPPIAGLVLTGVGTEAVGNSPNNNVVFSDNRGNVRGIINNLGYWGIGTNAPFANFQVNGLTRLGHAIEGVNTITTALAGTVNVNINNGAVIYYSSTCTGNFVFNFTGDGSATPTGTLNGIVQVGHSLTVAIITTQGPTAYYHTGAVQCDGAPANVFKWAGNAAVSFGNPNGFDVYVFNIIKTAISTFTVIGSQSQYGG